MAEEVTRIEVAYGVATCTLTTRDFEENTLVITASALSNSGFNVGGTSMAELSITLTRDGLHKMQTSNTLRRKAKLEVITVEQGITTKRGEFFITELKVNDYSAELTCYDGMVSFDDNLSESDLESLRNTGRTVSELFDFCIKRTDTSRQYDITLDTTVINGNLMNGGIHFKLSKDASITTFRNILEYASMLSGGFAYITVDNQLSLGFFTTGIPTDTIESDRVMEYSEDAYPSIVEKVKTSIAGFDIEKTGSSDPNKDGLTLAFYENPFLRGLVGENPTELPSVVTTAFDNIANSLLNTTVIGGSVNFVDNDMGVSYELGKPITVLRKVIPYNGAGATDEVESKLLVTGYTYTYGEGISLECNASSTNINPSSAGLNKYNGYVPNYYGGGSGYDERLDEIAERLEKSDMEFVYEGTLYDLALKTAELSSPNSSPKMKFIIKEEPDPRYAYKLNSLDFDYTISALPSLLGYNWKYNNGNASVSTLSVIGVGVYTSKTLTSTTVNSPSLPDAPQQGLAPFTLVNLGSSSDDVVFETISGKISDSLKDVGISQGNYYMGVEQGFKRSAHIHESYTDIYLESLNIELSTRGNNFPFDFYENSIVLVVRDDLKPTNPLDNAYTLYWVINPVTSEYKLIGDKWVLENLYNDFPIEKKEAFASLKNMVKPWGLALAKSISVRLGFSFTAVPVDTVPVMSMDNRISTLNIEEVAGVSTYNTRAVRPSTVDDIVSAINSMTPMSYTKTMWNSVQQWVGAVVDNTDIALSDLRKRTSVLSSRVDKTESTVSDIDKKLVVLDTSVKDIDKRVKALESGGTTPQPPEPPAPSTGTGSVFIAEHHNVLPVGVSATSKDVALFDVILKKDVTPVLQFCANVSVSKTGTVEFTVFSDGAEMPFKPKFLLQKTLENVSFFVPLSQISKDKRVSLHITGVTTDASIKIEPLGLSVTVINAEMPEDDNTFKENIARFSIDSSVIKMRGLTENVELNKGVL